VGENVLAHNLIIVFLVLIIMLTAIDPAMAQSKKKKSKADLEVEKMLTPITQELTPLTQKSMARGLFSPNEMTQALELKLKLLDLMSDYPDSRLLAKPAYEAGQLFRAREMYYDAYDFYNYVVTNFPDSPYASMSRVEIQRMKQKLGETYFSGAPDASSMPAMVP
jgi:hypothetical protein